MRTAFHPRLLVIALAALLGSLWGEAAFAVPLRIEPGVYQGKWAIWGVQDFITGPATLDLPAGNYTLYFGPRSPMKFTLSDSGDVTVADPVKVAASNGLIQFRTVDIMVDPGTHAGLWLISHVNDFAVGPQLRTLVPNVRYPVYLGFFVSFYFVVSENGVVTVQNSLSAEGGQNHLTLQTEKGTVHLTIDTGAYLGPWIISGFPEIKTGSRTFAVSPSKYLLKIGTLNTITLTVGADGSVTSSNPTAVQGGIGSAKFNTVPVAFNPGDFQGAWLISRVSDFIFTPGTLDLPMGLSYQMVIGNAKSFQFAISAAGKVTILDSSSSASVAGKQIKFKTARIRISPQSSRPVTWSLAYVTRYLTSAQTIPLVVGHSYTIKTTDNEFGTFTLNSKGGVSNEKVSVGTGTFKVVYHPCPDPSTQSRCDDTAPPDQQGEGLSPNFSPAE